MSLMSGLVTPPVTPDEAGKATTQDTQTQSQTQEIEAAVKTSEAGQITITSRGHDVREVLFDLFEQGSKSFVLEPSAKVDLYLALSGVEFEEALQIICRVSQLEFTLDNGIYFISKRSGTGAGTQGGPVIPPPPIRLTENDLKRLVTTKMERADIRAVFADFQRQSGIIIDVDAKVPAYKLDAFLVGTTLKFALDTVTKAADLEYVLTDSRSILIRPKAAPTTAGNRPPAAGTGH